MKNDPPLPRLSDAELQARIDRFASQMLEADERFQRTQSIEDRSARDQAWIAQKALLTEKRRRRRIAEEAREGRGLA